MPAPDNGAVERIGIEIRTMRKEYMLTQQQLAELAGISDRTLRDIEAGREGPSIGTVVKVLSTLGLDLEVRR
ncbi:helix-turn-helix domain-containing protein [Corynebacterium liangguodongii]|uniref:Transcriptional regulator n=1 Tax=Corynebacterium liangguodongii TaxID=2079535 RepID=A0A2S0WEK1_9CORY|nr:helix-turn-helix domain-containing protein [Corynebacterium liangguodongii]AWB84191.1 transcriptional regulator [Corynebacterium liangguodongii]PWC00201.1 transcriptional regulator [Corynebacterium liangguodongii]